MLKKGEEVGSRRERGRERDKRLEEKMRERLGGTGARLGGTGARFEESCRNGGQNVHEAVSWYLSF